MQDFERRINLDYPYQRFKLVEVPVQYESYQHIWAGGFENIQPEIVLIPEMGAGIREANFAGNIRNFERRSRRGGPGMTKKDYQVRALNNFCNLFTSEEGQANFNFSRGNFEVEERANPYYIFAQFFNQAHYIVSDELPIFNRILEAYLKSTFADMRTSFMRQFSGMSEDEMANMALQNSSFAELLNDPEQKQIIDNVIELKGDALFSNIRAIAGKENFEDFLYTFLEDHKYQVTAFSEFALALESVFDIVLDQYISDWFNSKELPGFLFSSVMAENVRSENMVQTMVQFKVSNMEDVPGVVKIIFRLGGPGGRGGFGGPGMGPEEDNTIEKLVYLEGQQTKEVSYLLDQAPRAMTINTMTSKNIPMEIIRIFRRVEENNRKTPFEGEVVVPDPVDLEMPNETVVDNEDPEFQIIQPESKGFFVRLFQGSGDDEKKYSGFIRWRIPVNWTLTTNSSFYGRYVRSAYYARQGTGDRMARWNVPIQENGYYEVFFYMEQQPMGRGFGRGPGDEGERDAGRYQFIIHHDDGEETLTVNLNDIPGGWNSLGSFYFSPDTARIELSNQGEGEMVIADAVKLIREDAY
jgi:hypothetical protein